MIEWGTITDTKSGVRGGAKWMVKHVVGYGGLRRVRANSKKCGWEGRDRGMRFVGERDQALGGKQTGSAPNARTFFYSPG